MVDIPDRENLEEMTRTDIQKLCKDNNIKANMRTDEMINALCDQANGKDVPRPHRSMSETVASQPPAKSRLPSHTTRRTASSKVADATSIRKALHPSESNTDAESVAETPAPVSAPTTRRKAKDIQTHLGKGRPAVAGGSGARKVTKVVSRGTGRKAKTSAMLQQDPIPEEEEENPPANPAGTITEPDKNDRPSSVRPQSQVPSGSHDLQPSQLPTPAPSLPSYSLPSAQFSALETRVAQLEHPNLAARIAQLEASTAELPALKASVAELPALRASAAQIPGLQIRLEEATVGVERCTRTNVELQARTMSLEAQITGLVAENQSLRKRVSDLEAESQEQGRGDASMGSVIIHSPERSESHDEGIVDIAPQVAKRPALTPPRAAPPSADPSPSQPTLGKRHRGDTSDVGDETGEQKPEDAELDAIHRVTRPLKKKARLEVDPPNEDGLAAFAAFKGAGPSSTSTPRRASSTSTPKQRRSDSPSGFFTAGRRVPTPLAKRDDLEAYLQLSPEGVGEMAVAGPSNTDADEDAESPSVDASVQTPPPSRGLPTLGFGGSMGGGLSIHDPGFFGSPPPIYQGGELPYPLNPTTPHPQDILERAAQLATPVLGAPWKYSDSGYVNPANISQLAESVGMRVQAPTTPGGTYTTASGLQNPFAPASSAAASGSRPRSPSGGVSYTFRAGGRRERNDKYNPYFTPQRGPNARHRTGLTPTRGFSVSLKSPAKMTSVAEGGEGENEDAAVVEDDQERSPQRLRTLYGTELDGDTRFSDYGSNLGRIDWGKFYPR